MTDETTSEQLAEIEGQAEDTPATEYTPPEGWRVVRFGEQLLPGDMWVHQDGTEQRSAILHWDASAVSGGRCIRRIKPQPEPQPTTDDPSGPGWRDVEPDELLRHGDLFWNVDHWQATQHAGQPAVDERTYRRRIEPQQPTPDDPSGPGWRWVEVGEVLQPENMFRDVAGAWVYADNTVREGWEHTYRRRIERETVDDLRQRLAEAEALVAEADRGGRQVNAELQQLREQLRELTGQTQCDAAELQQLREQVQTLTRERDRLQSWLQEHHKTGQQSAVKKLERWLRPVLELVAENPEDCRALAVSVLEFLPQIASRLIEE